MFDREWNEPSHAYNVGDFLFVFYGGAAAFAVCTKLLPDNLHEFIVLRDESTSPHLHAFTCKNETFVGERVGVQLFAISKSEVDSLLVGEILASPTIYSKIPVTMLMELKDQLQ